MRKKSIFLVIIVLATFVPNLAEGFPSYEVKWNNPMSWTQGLTPFTDSIQTRIAIATDNYPDNSFDYVGALSLTDQLQYQWQNFASNGCKIIEDTIKEQYSSKNPTINSCNLNSTIHDVYIDNTHLSNAQAIINKKDGPSSFSLFRKDGAHIGVYIPNNSARFTIDGIKVVNTRPTLDLDFGIFFELWLRPGLPSLFEPKLVVEGLDVHIPTGRLFSENILTGSDKMKSQMEDGARDVSSISKANNKNLSAALGKVQDSIQPVFDVSILGRRVDGLAWDNELKAITVLSVGQKNQVSVKGHGTISGALFWNSSVTASADVVQKGKVRPVLSPCSGLSIQVLAQAGQDGILKGDSPKLQAASISKFDDSRDGGTTVCKFEIHDMPQNNNLYIYPNLKGAAFAQRVGTKLAFHGPIKLGSEPCRMQYLGNGSQKKAYSDETPLVCGSQASRVNFQIIQIPDF